MMLILMMIMLVPALATGAFGGAPCGAAKRARGGDYSVGYDDGGAGGDDADAVVDAVDFDDDG
eukprot:6947579-Pyramimonas_sp.AAC.1